MGMKLARMVLAVSFLALAAACSGGKTDGGGTDVRGTSSGGGWYSDTNSTLLLKNAGGQLADAIDSTPASAFTNLPAGWTQSQFAQVFRDLDLRPNDVMERNGRSLMLNFDLAARHVIVLQPFFISYGSLSEVQATYLGNIAEVQKRLLHESGHLFGMDEAAAEQFSKQAFHALVQQAITCLSPKADEALVHLPLQHVAIYFSDTRTCLRKGCAVDLAKDDFKNGLPDGIHQSPDYGGFPGFVDGQPAVVQVTPSGAYDVMSFDLELETPPQVQIKGVRSMTPQAHVAKSNWKCERNAIVPVF